MKILLSIILLCFETLLGASDFDAWYFEYHTAPVIITGTFFAPNGAKVSTVSGERTGKLSADGESFEENSVYKYEPANIETSQTIVWRSTDKNGVFTGNSRDPNGVEISYRMTIKDKTSLSIESKSLDGRALIERCRLKPDGKVYVTGTMRSKAGDVIFEAKYVLSKVPIEKTELGGTNQSATRSEFESEGSSTSKTEAEGRSR